jgi:hypothetical protein
MIRFPALWLIGGVLGAAAPVAAQDTAPVQTILFVGNSFTFGANSPVWKYRANSVTDLNHDGVGGVPALFKLFTQEAGLNFAVSLETSPGKTLKWHWDNRQSAIDRPWDHVVMQEYSTLDPAAPGNPANTVLYTGRLAGLFVARNPKVEISLTATWSRPDQTYLKSGHWYGQPIAQMALDVRHANDLAAQTAPAIDKVHPVGQAFTCAITSGVAVPNPYDGVPFGKIDLWSWDQYHASAFGYYLEALVVFADVTGKDPVALGPHETAAAELGISPAVAMRLQHIASIVVSGQPCPAQ